ncbi:LysR family transcriptional regulator [Acidisoma sp. S159]|jgi:DNA-binding transcriptional LysR family regulator|uniref:LysR family transcriptional regulator n=1 Tax=Acidisoma sp. S159 TaxID=1747225 RepID=UPI00131C5BC1|nr:LysR family transcriptional regulator [Acidisoma sp. S159]
MIEFRQLRYLIAAAEAGSFSRAAQRLGIKQATLSRHILETEKRLGLVLFDRKTRGASLAVDGQTYLRKARHIVKELDELNEWVRSTRAGESGNVAVGFYTSFSAGNLRATLSEFSSGEERTGHSRWRCMIWLGWLHFEHRIQRVSVPSLRSRPEAIRWGE